MTAEEMKLSMYRTWVQNRDWKKIPTHYIVWSDGSFLKINELDVVLWATQSNDANWNWIHIEVVWNFNETIPTDGQYAMVKQIVQWIREKYPDIEIKLHKDFQQHTCPWKNFDMSKIEPFKPIPHPSWAKRPLPYIKWTTVNDRAISFAKSYWFSYDWFDNAWKKYWIKSEVLLCIAFAEWFGKWSWSTGNVMNCWNNDRWNRIDFDYWTKSVICAADKLKNWLLKNKQTIWDLSYRWNGTIDMQYIYASSDSNREINVLNCLGKIYNENLSPNFKFRNEN